MFTVFTNSMRRYLWQILGWGITFGAVAVYLMSLYKPLLAQQAQMQSLIDAYGASFLAFFGGSSDFLSPGGYMDFGFFSYMVVVAGIFAVIFGAGLLAADEEKGTLDLVLAHPISRTDLFWGRLLAFVVALISILLLTWAGFASGISMAGWDVSPFELLLPNVSMLVVLLLFGMLALLLSMTLPSRTLAASLAAVLLVASYFVTSMAHVSDRLKTLNDFSPLRYFQGGRAIEGLNWQNLLGLFGFAVFFALVAWLLFLRRDIRVSGEGSWRIPGLAFNRKDSA
jgi:ABC-2 type transport system permease protein